jgi:iron complex transport system permease protein
VTDLANRASGAPVPIRGRVVRRQSFSVRLDLRAIVVCSMLFWSTVAVGLWSISVGDFPIPISDVVATILRNPTEDSEFIVGIGAGFAINAAIDYMITRAEINDVQRAAVWLTGSLNARSWDEVRIVEAALIVLGPLGVLMQRNLDRLDLGDDTAAGLAINVSRSKLSLVLVGVGLAALGVSAAGPVAFIAFVAGPIARRLVNSPRACIVPAAFVGALITVVADLAARRLLTPTELPVGIMTALIGAPYLLWLLTRQARTGAL